MSTEPLTLSSEEIQSFSAPGQQESVPISFPSTTQKTLAWLDLKEGMQQWYVWLMLASQDIKLRYRRSVLGPLWITLSMAITVYSMGYLYGHLFKVSLEHYYPFLVTGMLGWSLILTLVLDYSEGFLTSHALIKQIKLPYSLHIHRITARNFLIFFHNLLVMLPIFVIFHQTIPINGCLLFLIPALVIIYINAFFYGLLIAMITARYRDIGQIIKSLMQVIFFITPVMWQPEGLQGHKRLIAELNPFYAFLELIREPLLGHLPSLRSLGLVFVMTLLGLLMSLVLLIRYRSRIIYWI